MNARVPVLVGFAGLPGTGKTTVAKALAIASGALYLRVDTVEAALRGADDGDFGSAAYAVMRAVAAENLALGRDVLADSVNPLAATREALADCARDAGARLIDVEIVCSNIVEHRRRVESRVADIHGRVLPDWEAVSSRDYVPWETPRIVIDTARWSVGAAVASLLRQMDL